MSGASDNKAAGGGGRERILSAAMATLEERGEAALRFADIAKEANVALSVITHHFGTREGLIAELHARRFASISARDHEALQHLAETASTRAEFAAGVAAITAATFDDSRSSDRFARVVSIGAMHGRPELAAAMRQEATAMIDRVTQVIITGQARGLISREFDPRAVATFIRAYALGMVERYLDERPTSSDAVVDVVLRAVGVFMTEPEDINLA
ncbi:MAG: TetR/AcrR family transcriptional regulator [Ilumatobacteraceae bacterium]